MMKKISLAILSTALIGWAGQARAATLVDVELAFLLDASNAVSINQFNTQRQALVDVFNDNFYGRYVAPLAGKTLKPGQIGSGQIAVSFYTFSGTANSVSFVEAVGWTQIASQSDASSVATAINNITRTGQARTPLAEAIKRAADGVFGNNFTSAQSVINLMSNGANLAPLSGSFFTIPLQGSNYARCAGDTSITSTCVNDLTQTIVAPGGVNALYAIGVAPLTSRPTLDTVTYGVNFTGSTQNVFVADSLPTYRSTLDFQMTTIFPSVPEPNLALGLIGLGIFGIGKQYITKSKNE